MLRPDQVREAAWSFAFDVAIFDEAHTTASLHEMRVLSKALHDCNLRIRQRLFMTATVHGKMSDEALYGKVIYQLSLAEAVERKCILPLKVHQIKLEDVSEIDYTKRHIRYKAVMDGLNTFLAQHPQLRRVLCFHNQNRFAEQFAHMFQQTQNTALCQAFHVNGSTHSAKKRMRIIRRFEECPARAMLTSARCLGIGWDHADADVAVLVDPRRSPRDVCQLMGRVQRLPNQGWSADAFGHILVPCLSPERQERDIAKGYHAAMDAVLLGMAGSDSDRRSLHFKGNELFKMGQYARAHEAYSKLLLVDPEDYQFNAIVHCNRGIAAAKSGCLEQAIGDCSAAIRLSESCTKAYMLRAKYALELGGLEAAQLAVNDYCKVPIRQAIGDAISCSSESSSSFVCSSPSIVSFSGLTA